MLGFFAVGPFNHHRRYLTRVSIDNIVPTTVVILWPSPLRLWQRMAD